MSTSWWAADVRDLIAQRSADRDGGATSGNRPDAAMAALPLLHLAGDVVLGRAVAGIAAKSSLAALAFPALVIGGAIAAVAYFAASTGRP